MRVLLDPNVLLRAVMRRHPASRTNRKAVRLLYERDCELCIAPQNVAEFWNVCTRPEQENGFGLAIAETDRHTRRLERLLTILPDTIESYRLWRTLVVEHQVRGAKVHDARLAALMSVHGVAQILTFNTSDFERFTAVEAVHPDNVEVVS